MLIGCQRINRASTRFLHADTLCPTYLQQLIKHDKLIYPMYDSPNFVRERMEKVTEIPIRWI